MQAATTVKARRPLKKQFRVIPRKKSLNQHQTTKDGTVMICTTRTGDLRSLWMTATLPLVKAAANGDDENPFEC
jgi:hypothetical protein